MPTRNRNAMEECRLFQEVFELHVAAMQKAESEMVEGLALIALAPPGIGLDVLVIHVAELAECFDFFQEKVEVISEVIAELEDLFDDTPFNYTQGKKALLDTVNAVEFELMTGLEHKHILPLCRLLFEFSGDEPILLLPNKCKIGIVTAFKILCYRCRVSLTNTPSNCPTTTPGASSTTCCRRSAL